MSVQHPKSDTLRRVSINPHALTPESLPGEGATVGYTGLAFFGDDFSDHEYITGALIVGERTGGNAAGFYAVTCRDVGYAGGDEVFVMFGDHGRQILHGYVLP